jgi:hypothetical protein
MLALHEDFPRRWTAEILPRRPLILPSRHFVYPADAEEVERGALEVLIQPLDVSLERPEVGLSNLESGPRAQPFLATCALGFRDPAAPTGVWSMPHPDWLCAVSGGYAYLIDVFEPSRFVFLRYRPVLEVLCFKRNAVQSLADIAQSETDDAQSAADDAQSATDDAQSLSGNAQSSWPSAPWVHGLLLFAGHHSILAWGRNGEAWKSDRLSSEGLTGLRIEAEDGGEVLRGYGWDLRTDRDVPFALDLRTGRKI